MYIDVSPACEFARQVTCAASERAGPSSVPGPVAPRPAPTMAHEDSDDDAWGPWSAAPVAQPDETPASCRGQRWTEQQWGSWRQCGAEWDTTWRAQSWQASHGWRAGPYSGHGRQGQGERSNAWLGQAWSSQPAQRGADSTQSEQPLSESRQFEVAPSRSVAEPAPLSVGHKPTTAAHAKPTAVAVGPFVHGPTRAHHIPPVMQSCMAVPALLEISSAGARRTIGVQTEPVEWAMPGAR